MIKSESIGKLVAALTKAQKTFQPVLKEKENPGFKRDGKNSKYADLAAAIEATQPALIENGLAVIQFPVNEGDRIGTFSILAHESGEFTGESFTLPLAQQNAQTGVGAVTYSRRAGYLAAIGVAAEDDDGNTAAGTTTTGTTSAKSEPKAKPKSTGTAVAPATAAVQPPSANPVPADLPTPDELKAYIARGTVLKSVLEKNGVKGQVGQKLTRYFMKVTDTESLDQITKSKWETVFQAIKTMQDVGGDAKLAEAIDSATEEAA
jgi:hypothetical protein